MSSGSSGNDKATSPICQEAEEVGSADVFIAEFDAWLFTHFREACIRAREYPSAEGELTSILLPWVEGLAKIAVVGGLREISPEKAARLHCFLRYALDDLVVFYDQCGASEATLLLALHPVEDILAFLSLRRSSISTETLIDVRGSKPPNGGGNSPRNMEEAQ